MALVIKPESDAGVIVDKSEVVDDLGWMQQTVGGYIESFHFRMPVEIDGEVFIGMIINEEGKLMKLPINHLATTIARKGGLSLADYIVGPAIVFERGEIE